MKEAYKLAKDAGPGVDSDPKNVRRQKDTIGSADAKQRPRKILNKLIRVVETYPMMDIDPQRHEACPLSIPVTGSTSQIAEYCS